MVTTPADILVASVNIVLLRNRQAVKKGVAQCKMASMKEVGKYKWWPRNSYGDRSATKISITTIQVILCCLIPASLGISAKFI